jgi:ribosome-associated translation inhibitor RaiA
MFIIFIDKYSHRVSEYLMKKTTRNTLAKEIMLRLGGQMVTVELDNDHYQLAIDKAFEKYRQRSENSVEEKFIDLTLQVDVNMYTLSDDVIEVKDIYQRASGATSIGQGNEIEPFQAQYLNTFLLQSGKAGGLALYDALAQQHETLGRLFGAEYQFTWNKTKHQLLLHRRPKSEAVVYLHCYNYREEEDLFADVYALPWLKDYSLSMSKLMLGEARGKFAQVPGPNGGTSLNGDTLKAEAQAEILALEEDIKQQRSGEAGFGMIIG